MSKINVYEGMFIINSDIGDDKIKETLEYIKQLITKNQGEIVSCQELGKKRLASIIKKKKDGAYVLMFFKMPTDSLVKIEKVLLIKEELLRHLIIIKKEEDLKNIKFSFREEESESYGKE